MRTSKMILKVPQIPKVTVEIKAVDEIVTVKLTKGGEAMGLLNEVMGVKKAAENEYDYVWRLRALLNNKISKQLEEPDKDYSFVIEFIKKRLSDAQSKLGVGAAGACC